MGACLGECSVEALNPVEMSAAEMEPAVLRREFGKDLIFWGGGCDPVVLRYGTPE